jgi:hypothetical protein
MGPHSTRLGRKKRYHEQADRRAVDLHALDAPRAVPDGGWVELGLDAGCVQAANRLAGPALAGERRGAEGPALDVQGRELAVDLDRLAQAARRGALAGGRFDIFFGYGVGRVASDPDPEGSENAEHQANPDEPLAPAMAGLRDGRELRRRMHKGKTRSAPKIHNRPSRWQRMVSRSGDRAFYATVDSRVEAACINGNPATIS